MALPLELLFVEGPAERSLLGLADEALALALRGAPLHLVHRPSREAEGPPARPWDLVLLGLSAGLEAGGPELPERERLLGERIAALQQAGAVVALSTVFRHVPEEHPQRVELRSRIRQLNLLARRLSARLGCFVLDLDRELAHEGARALVADCFGGGEKAAEVALSELMVLALEMLGDRLPEEAP